MNGHRFRTPSFLLAIHLFILPVIGGVGSGCSQSDSGFGKDSPRMYSSKEFDSDVR